MDFKKLSAGCSSSAPYVAAIFASLSLTFMNCFIKLCQVHQGGGCNLFIIVFARFFFATLFILPSVIFDQKIVLKTRCFRWHLLRSISGFLTILCLFYSLRFISLADSTVLFMTYPLFVTLCIMLFFGEHVQLKKLLWLAFGFIGIIFVLQPGLSVNTMNSKAAFIALLSGFLAAIGILIVKKLGKSEPARRTVFYFSINCTIFSGVLLIYHWQWPFYRLLPILIAVGLCGVLYQQGLAYALRKLRPEIVSPVMFSSIIFSSLLDWALWHAIPNLLSMAGYVIIFFGVLMAIRHTASTPTP